MLNLLTLLTPYLPISTCYLWYDIWNWCRKGTNSEVSKAVTHSFLLHDASVSLCSFSIFIFCSKVSLLLSRNFTFAHKIMNVPMWACMFFTPCVREVCVCVGSFAHVCVLGRDVWTSVLPQLMNDWISWSNSRKK